MSALEDKDEHWKTISRRSLRSAAKIRRGEIPAFQKIGALLTVGSLAFWLFYVSPLLGPEARHIYFSYPLLHTFIDNADEFVMQAILVSCLPVICVSYVIAYLMQLQFDKFTEPVRDKERRDAQRGMNLRGVR